MHAKRDHAIGEEFFRDILDEHFSADEVERQFETALNWGRYAEIFDYDSETKRLFHNEEAETVPSLGEIADGAQHVAAIRILGKGPWSLLPAQTWSVLTDFVIFAAGLSVFYAILVLGRTWLGPFNPHVEISRDPTQLPIYAAYSLLRITVAYVLSLAFTLVYGYVAAYNPKAERIMIPLLDTLQSIPVLSFLPGVMLAMVALFPHHQIGVELGAILLIFTGQVWNMAFSFYSSLKSIPRDMREAAKIYRFNWYQRFTQFELPYAAIGLVWNSMMSVAGGWFFLMACEMFVLGKRDFRLPGLGSYLQTAASAGDTQAIFWGVGVMIAVIVLIDQIVWRPVIAWAEKFKMEQVESADVPRSWFLNVIQGSRGLIRLRKRVMSAVARAAGDALRPAA